MSNGINLCLFISLKYTLIKCNITLNTITTPHTCIHVHAQLRTNNKPCVNDTFYLAKPPVHCSKAERKDESADWESHMTFDLIGFSGKTCFFFPRPTLLTAQLYLSFLINTECSTWNIQTVFHKSCELYEIT